MPFIRRMSLRRTLRYYFIISLVLMLFLGPLTLFADEPVVPNGGSSSLEIISPDSVQSQQSDQKVTVSGPKLISLDYINADLTDVLKAIAYSYNINIIITKNLEGKISAKLKDFSLDDALNAILSVHNYGFMRKGGIVYVCPQEELDQATETLPLSFLTIKEAKTLLSTAKTKFKGTIQENEDTNALVVTANPVDMQLIKSYLKGIDVPPLQVMIDAKIVNISKQYSKDIGATMNFTYSPSTGMGVSLLSGATRTIENTLNTTNTNALNTSNSSGTTGTSTSTGTVASGTGTTTQVTGNTSDGSVSSLLGNWKHFSPVLAINALVTENKARVIASPSIATLNGHEASILIGDHYPYVSSTSTAGGTGGSVVNQTQTQYIDIGTKLKVTPFVSPDGWITLKVEPEVSSLIGLVNGNPDIATTSASTEVRVRNNETIVIGGLDSRNTNLTKNGTPWIMSIPIIGWFFHHDSSLVNDGTLTVLITPHIVSMAPPVVLSDNNKRGQDSNLIKGLLDYAKGLDEDKSKDSAQNLNISEEQIKTYRMILEEFPQSSEAGFCWYRIVYIYVKEFGDCAAGDKTLIKMEEDVPRSPYMKEAESMVNECVPLDDRGGKK